MPQTILGSFTGEWFDVHTARQAQLLSDNAALRHFKPFIGRTLSVSQAARELGVSTERMMYRARQFVQAGLLHPAGKVRRAGRPMRLYRAPAGLRVPFALTPFEDLEAQVTRHARAFDRLRARAAARSLLTLPDHARLIYRDDLRGDVHSETFLPDPGLRSRVIGGDFVGVVWLPPDRARALQAALDELLLGLGAQESRGPGTRPYLVQGALLPLDPDNPAEWSSPPG